MKKNLSSSSLSSSSLSSLSSFLFSFSILSLLVFSGCQFSENNPEISKSSHEKIVVVTSFYPLEFLTKEIGGDKATVINLAGNTEVHDFKPSPKDIVTLNTADLVIVQGAGLEPWAEDIIPQLQAKHIPTLETSHALTLHKMEENEEEGLDPHTWLNPVLAQQMVNEILIEMKQIDPENSDTYTRNAQELHKKLQAFNTRYQQTFAHCKKNAALTSHDAFGYVARQYGLTLYPIAGISPHDEPSAKILVELKQKAKQTGVSAILTEKNNVTNFAEMLSKETGLKILPVTALETDEQSFLQGYEENLKSFKTAFECQ